MPSIHGWYGLRWLCRYTLSVWYRDVRMVAADVIHEVGDPPQNRRSMLLVDVDFFPMWKKCGDIIFILGFCNLYTICVYISLSKLDQYVLYTMSKVFVFFWLSSGNHHISPCHGTRGNLFPLKALQWLDHREQGVKFLRNGSFVPRRVRSKFKGSKLNQ